MRAVRRPGLLPALLALLMAVSCGGSGAPVRRAADVSRFSGLIGGAPWVAEVPQAWNRTLVLYSHGYVGVGSASPAQDASDRLTAAWLLEHGYAIAGSGYSSTGWAVADAVRDQLALLDELQRRLGKPRRIIAWGQSMGGLITAELEGARPHLLAGALPMCGVVAGGVPTFDTALDGAFAFRALLSPGLQLVNLRDAGAQLAAADRALDRAEGGPLGLARLALVAALAGLPTWYDASSPLPRETEAQALAQARWIRASGLPLSFLFRADVEARAGGNPSGNAGVDYARQLAASPTAGEVEALYRLAGASLERDLATLAAAPRVTADPAAVTWLHRTSDPPAPTVPTLTLHGTDDGLIIAQQESAYSAGARLFVHRPGHCNFSPAEMLAAFQALVQRLDTGRWGDLGPAAMNAAAGRVGADFNGITASQAPGSQFRPQFTGFEPAPFPRR